MSEDRGGGAGMFEKKKRKNTVIKEGELIDHGPLGMKPEKDKVI